MNPQVLRGFALVHAAALQPGGELHRTVLHELDGRRNANPMSSPARDHTAQSPTAPMLPMWPMMNDRQFQRKAAHILRENVRVLLDARKEEQIALARHCGHDKSWINKFLNEGRGVTLKDFDKIASFFGVETYQLFQPGISRLTERRIGADRRAGDERRVGHQGRALAMLRTELNKLPAVAHGSSSAHSPALNPTQVAMQRLVERFTREAVAIQSGGQAAMAGAGGAGVVEDRRKRRRSVPKPA